MVSSILSVLILSLFLRSNTETLACDHTKVTPYFIESINSQKGFYAGPCRNLLTYIVGWCQPSESEYVLMGEHCSPKYVECLSELIREIYHPISIFHIAEHAAYTMWPQIQIHHSHEVYLVKQHDPIRRAATMVSNKTGYRMLMRYKQEIVKNERINRRIFGEAKNEKSEMWYGFILNEKT